MEGQISIFDYLNGTDKPMKKIALGYLRSEEQVKRYKGDVIPFQDLEKYVGKYVLYEMPRESAVDYKVIKLTSYHKDCDTLYRVDGEELGTCDRIGYSDDNRKEKENSWVSEHFFRNGRFHDPDDNFLNLIYELKE